MNRIVFDDGKWKIAAGEVKVGDIIQLEHKYQITSVSVDRVEDGYEFIQAYRVTKSGALGNSYLSAAIGYRFAYGSGLRGFNFHRTKK